MRFEVPPLNDVVELLAELGDLKRIRFAGCDGSIAEQGFRRAWTALAAETSAEAVAQAETAAAVAAARLGGIDAQVLQAGGLAPEKALVVLERGVAAVAAPLDAVTRGWVHEGLRGPLCGEGTAPPFVDALIAQPRAGATRPGRPRLMLEPAESHADHCWIVAVYGALLAPRFAADRAAAFLTGLAHHLYNAVLPDSGFAGEALLGEEYAPLLQTLTAAQLEVLAEPLRGRVAALLDDLAGADTPAARAFHAADVLDRVLQMVHYARAAAFTVDQALDDLDLVHPGPVQAFHFEVLSAAGLG